MKEAATKAGVCSAMFLGDLPLIDVGTSHGEPPRRETSSSPYDGKRKTAIAKTTHPSLVRRTERRGNSGSSWGLCPGSPSLKGVPHTLFWSKFALWDQGLHRYKRNSGPQGSWLLSTFSHPKCLDHLGKLAGLEPVLLLFPVKGTFKVSHRKLLLTPPINLVGAEDLPFSPLKWSVLAGYGFGPIWDGQLRSCPAAASVLPRAHSLAKKGFNTHLSLQFAVWHQASRQKGGLRSWKDLLERSPSWSREDQGAISVPQSPSPWQSHAPERGTVRDESNPANFTQWSIIRL